MQINNILILVDNNFASNKEEIIKIAKLITKNCKYLIFAQLIKFNKAKIKLNSKDIVLTKKCYINSIFLVTNQNVNSISLKKIIRKKLLFKKQYLA